MHKKYTGNNREIPLQGAVFLAFYFGTDLEIVNTFQRHAKYVVNVLNFDRLGEIPAFLL